MTSNSSITAWVENKARGSYRWERDEGWVSEHGELCDFDEGDAIVIDPFKDVRDKNSKCLWPVYAEFRGYVEQDIAKVYIPPAGEGNPNNVWFDGPAGEYYIHQGYLTPQ